MVALDTNCNGMPDEDEWYELAGSEYHNPMTRHGYEITYSHPDGHQPVRDPTGILTDTLYIPWRDNFGGKGFVAKNMYHTQSYWPQWLDREDVLTFRGTRLPDNGVDESRVGTYYVLYSYPWGYADNHPNTDERSGIKIEWAVKADGSPANLSGIDFVKVATGLNQVLGPIGESSTEVSGAEDLHVDADGVEDNFATSSVVLLNTVATNCLHVSCVEPVDVSVYSLSGACLAAEHLAEGDNAIDVASLVTGVYILRTPKAAFRFVKY